MTERRKRGRPIRVSDEWIKMVAEARGQTTLASLGKDLARQLGLPKPISPARMHEYLSGRTMTAEVAQALAMVVGVPAPTLSLEDDPELLEWCDLGRRLRRETADRFRQELAAIREIVEVLERHRRRPVSK